MSPQIFRSWGHKKSIAELGHSDRLKIYVDYWKIYVDLTSNLFSETTASLVLKFHMQHDEATGLQNDDILPGRE